jgi:hypothetical protein
VIPGRRPTGRALLDLVAEYKGRADLVHSTFPDLITNGTGVEPSRTPEASSTGERS